MGKATTLSPLGEKVCYFRQDGFVDGWPLKNRSGDGGMGVGVGVGVT